MVRLALVTIGVLLTGDGDFEGDFERVIDVSIVVILERDLCRETLSTFPSWLNLSAKTKISVRFGSFFLFSFSLLSLNS